MVVVSFNTQDAGVVQDLIIAGVIYFVIPASKG